MYGLSRVCHEWLCFLVRKTLSAYYAITVNYRQQLASCKELNGISSSGLIFEMNKLK
jgi:hypothetical protein